MLAFLSSSLKFQNYWQYKLLMVKAKWYNHWKKFLYWRKCFPGSPKKCNEIRAPPCRSTFSTWWRLQEKFYHTITYNNLQFSLRDFLWWTKCSMCVTYKFVVINIILYQVVSCIYSMSTLFNHSGVKISRFSTAKIMLYRQNMGGQPAARDYSRRVSELHFWSQCSILKILWNL